MQTGQKYFLISLYPTKQATIFQLFEAICQTSQTFLKYIQIWSHRKFKCVNKSWQFFNGTSFHSAIFTSMRRAILPSNFQADAPQNKFFSTCLPQNYSQTAGATKRQSCAYALSAISATKQNYCQTIAICQYLLNF